MELKSNELRIGNWIRTTTDEQVCDVLCDCINTHEHECLLYDMIAPIPLIEEWLVRFGFEKDKMFFEFSIHTIRINIVLFPISPKNKEYQVKINNSTTQIFIKYVHQLQNLYFALTGEELELSPK